MDTREFDRARRGLILGLGAGALLAACGGGADAPGGPRIEEFSADQTGALVGESVRLTARFSGGSARIEPGIGAVTSGVAVQTPPLAGPTTFRLIVDNGVVQVARDLALPVAYRNRYRALAQPFISARHAIAALGDGSLLAIGGSRGEFTLAHTIFRFDPQRETLSEFGALGAGREFHSATVLADGRVLVAGGAISLSGFSASELIDPRTGAVTPTGALKQSRQGHTATLLADGRVLIAGGYSAAPTYRFAELFDPATETFTPVAGAALEPLALHAAHRLADGSVLIAGGENGAPPIASAAVLRFDPARGVIEAVAPLTAPRTLVASVAAADGRLLLFGGIDADLRASARAESYRHGAGAAPLPALPGTRAWHSVTRLASGRVLILGGEDAGGNFVASALLYE